MVSEVRRSYVVSLGAQKCEDPFSECAVDSILASATEISTDQKDNFVYGRLRLHSLGRGYGGAVIGRSFRKVRTWLRNRDIHEVITGRTCLSGSCSLFFNNNSIVKIPIDESLKDSFETGMSVEAWVRPVYSKRNRGQASILDGGFLIAAGGRELHFDSYPGYPRGRNQSLRSGDVFPRAPTGAWYHLAATFDGSLKRIYVNGVQVGSKKAAGKFLVDDRTQFHIGEGLSGYLDEVRLWNRAIQPAEILKNMRRKLTGQEQGLVVYLQFDEGKDDLVKDRSRNGYHGWLGEHPGDDAGDPKWSTDTPF